MNKGAKMITHDKLIPPFKEIPRALSFPEVQISDYSGIKVASYRNSSQPLIYLNIIFGAGAASESIKGSTNIAMQLLLSSVKDMNEEELADKFEFYGASFHTITYWNNVALTLSVPALHYEKCLELVQRAINDLDLKEAELAQLKKHLIASIDYNLTSPDFVSQMAYNNSLLNGTVYSRPHMGTKSDIFSVTLEDCRTLLTDTTLPSLKIIVMTGNFTNNHLELTAKKLSECITRKELNTEIVTPVPIKSLVLAPRPNATQSVLRLGKITLPKNHEDYPAVQVANTVFGGFFMSRINSVLRENQGLTYGASSAIKSFKHFSTLTVNSSLNSEGIIDTINFLNKLFNTLPENPITKTELQRCTHFMYGSFIRGIETPSLIANMLHSILSDDLPTDFYNHFYARIIELTPEEVTHKAHEHLSADSFTISVCSDENILRSKFDYDKTLIYDAEREMS